MIYCVVPLVFVLMQPATVPPCLGAQHVTDGHEVRCSGVLIGPRLARQAIKCKEVEAPRLEAQLLSCQGTSQATIEYLERRALSAESALRLTPKPMSTFRSVMISISLISTGFLAGFFVKSIK